MKTKRKATAAPAGDPLPPAHKTFLVTDNSCVPLLRNGEYAVVDTADRDLQNGEAYLIQWSDGERKRAIVKATVDRHGWWVGAVRRFPAKEEAAHLAAAAHKKGKVAVLGYTTDGPYEIDYLNSRLIGRIVGKAASPLGELIGPAAGWENEDAGNAAFNPAEYVDALVAAGWGPRVFYRQDGTMGYADYTPLGCA